jgi:hypothetical protein
MGARTVAGADGRTWSVRRNIEWKVPVTGDEFEHDVDGGRGAVVLILSALVLFWVAVFVALYLTSMAHIPWYLVVVAVAVLAFFPLRWVQRRPWTLVAETSGGYDLPAEHWSGMVRGRGRAQDEMRVVIRSLRTRATPGHADSPLHPVN